MFQKAKAFFLICETPMHAGSGTDLGIVDLPIQRERHTGYPKIEGSGLKGSIREVFEAALIKEHKPDSNQSGIKYKPIEHAKNKFGSGWEILWEEWKEKALKYHQAINLSFGPEEGDLHAGALGFSDARILLFPVKSMQGVFAWITCPGALEQFRQDLNLAGINDMPELPERQKCTQNTNLLIKDTIVLEEYALDVTPDSRCSELAKWLAERLYPVKKPEEQDLFKYWRDKMKADLVVLSDDDFRDFVEMSTEVVTRTKIDNKTGTVQPGALFTEEYLPPETVLYALALATPVFSKDKGVFAAEESEGEAERIMEFLQLGMPEVIQIGGNATIGKGLTRVEFI